MAQYSIIRMRKFKFGDVQGIQKHNQRQSKNSSNKDIDSNRTKLNYDLVNREKIKYESLIKEKIAERVKRKPRENSVVLCEFLISASPEYMEDLSFEEQKRYFETSLEHIRLKYGFQNVLYASVHNDEANPHMHVGITPITADNRLSAKDLFNGKQVMIQLQTDFNGFVNEQGFELDRGESSDRKNVEVHQFKKEKLEEKIDDLEYQINAYIGVVKKKKTELNELVKAVENTKPVDEVKIEKGALFSSKTVKLDVSDFNNIKALAKASEALKIENKAIEREFTSLRASNSDLRKSNERLKQENKVLEEERNEFKGKYERLEKLLAKMREVYQEKMPGTAFEYFEHIQGFCKNVVNRSMNYFSEFKFRESEMTENEKVGFSVAEAQAKQAKQVKNKRLENELER